MQPVHAHQQRLGKKSPNASVIHHQVGMILKFLADARQRPVFLWPRKENELPFDHLVGSEGLRRINQGGLDALGRRHAGVRFNI